MPHESYGHYGHFEVASALVLVWHWKSEPGENNGLAILQCTGRASDLICALKKSRDSLFNIMISSLAISALLLVHAALFWPCSALLQQRPISCHIFPSD